MPSFTEEFSSTVSLAKWRDALVMTPLRNKEIDIVRADNPNQSKGVKYDKNNRKPKIEVNNELICETTYNTLSAESIKQDVLSKDLTANVVLGGAFELSDFTQTGKMNLLASDKINPVTLTLIGARLPEGNNSITVSKVDATSLRLALNDLLEKKANGKPTHNFVLTTKEVLSEKEFELSIGISVHGFGAEIKNNFKYNYNRNTKKFLLDYKNEQFVAQAIPSKLYYADEALNQNESLVYVDKITYGQRILVSYELNESSTELENSLSLNAGGTGVKGGSAEVNANLKEKYKNVEFKMLAYGVGGHANPFVIQGLEQLLQALNNFFKEANNPSDLYSGAFGDPISYSLRFLNGDVAIAKANIENIPVRKCRDNEDRLYEVTISLTSFQGRGDADMYGFIGLQAFDSDNRLIPTSFEVLKKTDLLWHADHRTASSSRRFDYPQCSLAYQFSKDDLIRGNGAYFKLIYCPNELDDVKDDFFHLVNPDERIFFRGGDFKVRKVFLKHYFNQPNNLKSEGFEFSDTVEDTGDSATFNYVVKFGNPSRDLVGDLINVHGAIFMKWQDLGGEHSFLGRPIQPETFCPDQHGVYVHFQGGSIYWTPETGAQIVYGEIRNKWSAMGWERSLLGYPTTDELPTPDGVGRFNHFQGGSIYWTPETGAHEIHGAIRDKWASLGWERSHLGYPTSDEYTGADGKTRISNFQHGRISWTPEGGAIVS